MDKELIFKRLADEDAAVLLKLLDYAYEELKPSQRRSVFGEIAKSLIPEVIEGEALLQEIQNFQQASLNGDYYAPFNVNSKNFMDIPEETSEWCDLMRDFLESSSRLSQQGDHELAVECFRPLYELIDAIDSGEEIVFAEEVGSWMIPGDQKVFLQAYLTSLAATATPEVFTEQVLPLVRRDSYSSFVDKVYTTARKFANDAQKKHLQAEVKRQNIRTRPRS